MTLTGKQKHYLRSIAHNKNVIISIGGKGLTDAVMKEIELALEHHELIKVKLPSSSKAEKTALLTQITEQSNSALIQLIGRVGVVYRPTPEPRITLPSI